MDITVCMVGINGWEEWTKPAILSIQKWEPDVDIVLIDNGSDEPYPQMDGVQIVRTERICWAAAINVAVRASEDSDWWLVINNDVACLGRFVGLIQPLPDDAIYGRVLLTERGHTWLSWWVGLISKRVWEMVGQWDELFKMCAFDDADYCIRAKRLGFDTRHIALPFLHYEGKTRWRLKGYNEVHQDNRLYFESKYGWFPGGNMVVTHE